MRQSITQVNPLVRLMVFTAGAILLTSCEPALSLGECQYTNWHAKGVMDGTAGLPANTVFAYQNACSQHGVRMNSTSYEQGRQQGLAQYCTINNGFNVGIYGGQYLNACPVGTANLFLAGYQPAFAFYVARKQLNDARASVGGNLIGMALLLAVGGDAQSKAHAASEMQSENERTLAVLDQLRLNCVNALTNLTSSGFVSPFGCDE